MGRAIVDNIITHIPLKRLTPDELEATELPSGDDWNLMTEASFQNDEKKSDQIDPRFAKLKDLLSDDTSES
ncbi:YceD family protein [Aerococcus tenax]